MYTTFLSNQFKPSGKTGPRKIYQHVKFSNKC